MDFKESNNINSGVSSITKKIKMLKEYFDQREFKIDVVIVDSYGSKMFLTNAKVDNCKKTISGYYDGFLGARLVVPFSNVAAGEVIWEVTKSSGSSGGGG